MRGWFDSLAKVFGFGALLFSAFLISSSLAHAATLDVQQTDHNPTIPTWTLEFNLDSECIIVPAHCRAGLCAPDMCLGGSKSLQVETPTGSTAGLPWYGSPTGHTLAGSPGLWKFNVRFEINHPITGVFLIRSSNIVEKNLQIISTPTWSGSAPTPEENTNFTLAWSSNGGAALFELQESNSTDFSNPSAMFFPSNPWEVIPGRSAGDYYYRVRGWTAAPENGGTATDWSATRMVTVNPPPPPATPTLNTVTPNPERNQQFTVSWSSSPEATIYELQQSDTSDFAQTTAAFWPGNTWEVIPGQSTTGDIYFRVRAWTAAPENDGVSSTWSNTVTVTISAGPIPEIPMLFQPLRPPVSTGLTVKWTEEDNAAVYQLQEDLGEGFGNGPEYWPGGNWEYFENKSPGTYTYRVRAWNAPPEQGGQSSDWSDPITVTVLNDTEFLDLLQETHFNFMVNATSPLGLTLDRVSASGAETTVASTAASGFYLTALTIGVERGWITQTEGFNRALTVLQTFDTVVDNEHGFFYHFLQPDGSPSSDPFLEVSTIDTALFIAGALQAGEYFGGQVATLADSIYERVEWTWLYDSHQQFMHQAWTETAGKFGYYGSYSEAILLNLLAIGSPTHPIPAESFYAIERPKGNYNGPDFVFTQGGQMFVYQYPQLWYDFRNTTDALGVNWYDNSVEAAHANQRYCIDHSYMGYNQYIWGLTASDGPDVSPSNPYGYEAFGAMPSYFHASNGTIAPTGMGGSVFLAPDIAIPGLKYIYTHFGDNLWTDNGFRDSFNPNMGWFDDWHLAIDQGAIVLSIENYRSDLVWDSFMQNEHVIRSMRRASFSGYAPQDKVIEDFEDQNFWSPDTTLGWWDSDGSTVYQRFNELGVVSEGSVSMGVQYNKSGIPWSLMGGHISSLNDNKDFSGYGRLTMDVYGDAPVLLKLRDAAVNEQDVATLQGNNPNGWNTLEFDLEDVSIDTTRIDNLLLFVEPGNGTASGITYLDNVRLETRDPIVIEDFEDGNMWSPDTTLGWWDNDGSTVYNRWVSKDPSHGGFNGMSVDYNKNGLAWSLTAGFISASNPNRDFSQRNRLTFWIHGIGEVLVKLRDRQYNEVELGTVGFSNAVGWTRVSLDYSWVDTIDLTDVDNILFFVDPGEAWTSGNIAIDDIVIE